MALITTRQKQAVLATVLCVFLVGGVMVWVWNNAANDVLGDLDAAVVVLHCGFDVENEHGFPFAGGSLGVAS